jgi:hypothetical protein
VDVVDVKIDSVEDASHTVDVFENITNINLSTINASEEVPISKIAFQ